MPYNTKQREAVLSYLRTLDGRHFNAAEIAAHFTENGEKVGLTTVYRQLERLVEEGRVKKYLTDGSAACYQYISEGKHCGEHFHLKCEKCGKLIHLECRTFDHLSQHILEEHGFLSDPSRTMLYGTCRECREKKEKNDKE